MSRPQLLQRMPVTVGSAVAVELGHRPPRRTPDASVQTTIASTRDAGDNRQATMPQSGCGTQPVSWSPARGWVISEEVRGTAESRHSASAGRPGWLRAADGRRCEQGRVAHG
jgi:hypothetical protein